MATGLQVHPLSIAEQAQTGGTHEVLLDSRALTDGDASQVIPLFNVAAKQSVELLTAETQALFDSSSDADLASTLVEIGDDGDTDRFLTSTETNPSSTEVFLKGGVRATYVYTADNTVDAKVDCTATHLLSAHTQGRLRLVFRITDARA